MTRSEAARQRASRPGFREHMRTIRRLVPREALQEAGRRGFQVTREKHGRIADRFAALWRLAHPSPQEEAVIGLLQELGQCEGTHYLREFEEPFGASAAYWLDFAWLDSHRAIEVYGGRLHTAAGPDPSRPARDSRRLRELEECGWWVLVLTDADLADLTACRERVRRFLKGMQP